MTMLRPAPRAVLALSLVVPLLSSCGWFAGLFGGAEVAPDPSEAVYRAAMADFSTCGTTTDPALRAEMAARLAGAAGILQAEARPSNPDHFFMSDRVSAAAAYCAAAVEG